MGRLTVHVVDDDESVRASLGCLLEVEGYRVVTYPSPLSLLSAARELEPGCIVTDMRMPGMTGLELINRMKAKGDRQPVIMMTGHADVPLAVQAMHAGVADFLEKPFEPEALVESVRRALASREAEAAERARCRRLVESLTAREHQVLEGVVAGKLNKVIAYDLGISRRTVEIYRANIMQKTDTRGLSELVRMAMAAGI